MPQTQTPVMVGKPPKPISPRGSFCGAARLQGIHECASSLCLSPDASANTHSNPDSEPNSAELDLTSGADQCLITTSLRDKDSLPSVKISPPKPLGLTLQPSSVRPRLYEQLAADSRDWFSPSTPPLAERRPGRQRDVIIVSCIMLRPEHPAWPFSSVTTGAFRSSTRAPG